MRNYIEILLKPHSQRKFSLKTIEEQIKDTIEKIHLIYMSIIVIIVIVVRNLFMLIFNVTMMV